MCSGLMSADGRAVVVVAAGGAIGSDAGCALTVAVGGGATGAGCESMQPLSDKASGNAAKWKHRMQLSP